MRVAYFQCAAGVSGDMLVASLLDAGASLDRLREEIRPLGLKGVHLSRREVRRAGFRATQFSVAWDEAEHSPRDYAEIEQLLQASSLSASIKEQSIRVLQRLADAEAAVHGSSRERVHFHEVGAVDTLVDVVGTLLALAQLGVESVVASPINVGSGLVECSHGTLPVPAPGAAKLLEGVPIYSEGPPVELATPTGVALLTTLAEGFSAVPPVLLETIGYGAGGRDHPRFPNVLRVFVGSGEAEAGKDVVVKVEANIDDMNPEFFEHVVDRLLDSGAVDVFVAPVVMKKGRPGHLLTLLAPPQHVDRLADLLFRETSTFGIRLASFERRKLLRDWVHVKTPFGSVRVKVGRRGEEVLQVAPEYEDCRRIAAEKGVPLRKVYDAARLEAERHLGRHS